MEHGTDRIVLVTEADSKSKIQKVHAILKQTEDDIGSGYWLGHYWKVCFSSFGVYIFCIGVMSDVSADSLCAGVHLLEKR